MARRRICLREDGVEAGDACVRDEPLRPVEDVLIAFARGLGAHRRRVGTRSGLRQRVRRKPFAAREARQEALLLLLRPGQFDPERAQLLDREDEPRRRADLRELLDRDQNHQRAGATAAVLLVERQAEELLLTEELDEIPGELGLLVDLGCAWRHALAGKRAHEVSDLALLVAQGVVWHEKSLFAVPE